jgi:hypothetical protein
VCSFDITSIDDASPDVTVPARREGPAHPRMREREELSCDGIVT